MTGTRATSGSPAIMRRKVVIASATVEQALIHVHIDDLGAVLDLLPGDGHSLGVITLGDEFAKAAEPVTFVRSPTLTKLGTDRVMKCGSQADELKGSRPDRRMARSRRAGRRGWTPFTALAMRGHGPASCRSSRQEC